MIHMCYYYLLIFPMSNLVRAAGSQFAPVSFPGPPQDLFPRQGGICVSPVGWHTPVAPLLTIPGFRAVCEGIYSSTEGG